MKKVPIIFFMFFLSITDIYALAECGCRETVEDIADECPPTPAVSEKAECPGEIPGTECPKILAKIECPKSIEPPYKAGFAKKAVKTENLKAEYYPKVEIPGKKWQVSQFLDYKKWKFSGDNSNMIFQTIFTLTRHFEKGDISLSGSYISLKSDSQITVTKGFSVQRIRKISNTKVSRDDYGDLFLNGDYYLMSEENKKPLDVDLYGYLKLPVADRNKGLGTGEFDSGAGIGLRKTFFSGWKIFGALYYIFIGGPSSIDLNNETKFDVGVGFYFRPEADLNLVYAQSTAIAPGQTDPSDITLNLKWKTSGKTTLYGETGFGLSKGSPDNRLKLGISLLF